MMRFLSWRWTCVLMLVGTAAPAFGQAIPIERADVDHDCVVTQADLNLVVASYNKRSGQTGFNPDADVDRDGQVTLTDRTFVQRAIGTRVCTPGEPAPTILATVTPAPNANGWENGDVTISYTCDHVVSCPASVTLTSEGANQAVDRTVSNSSGVTASVHTVVNIDRTPPLLALTLPASGPPGGTVPLSLTATDLSGLATAAILSGTTTLTTLTASPYSFNVPLPAQAGATRTISIVGTDRAGNVASIVRTLTATAADTTVPAVILTVTDTAAPGAVIPVRVSASDPVGLAHLALAQQNGGQSIPMGEVSAAPFALQQAFTVPQVPDGTTVTFVGTANDAAGNVGTATATVMVASTVQSKTFDVSVDKPVSPTFQSNAVLQGHLRPATGNSPPVPPAFLASLTPAIGRLGDTVDVTITGVNTQFTPSATQLTFGAGIAIQQITVQSPTTVVAHILIDAKAALGPRLVAASTGTQEALLANAFTIVAGQATVSGRLVAPSGTGVAGQVCLPSSTTCVTAAADGTFALPIDSTIGRIVVSAAGFESASVLVAVAPGGTQLLGNITLVAANDPSPPPPPTGPVLPAPLATLLARMSGVTGDSLSLSGERARKIVIDSILLVGADELGVLDASGNQLNPSVAGAGPMSLTDAAVADQARSLRQGTTVSLEEMAVALAMSFEWSSPGPPDPDTLVAILQQRVNEAWANPTADESSLAILLFNQGPTLTPLPPRLSRTTRVNSLQAFLVLSSVVLQGYQAQAGTGSASLDLGPARALWAWTGGAGSSSLARFSDRNTIDASRSRLLSSRMPMHYGQSSGTPTHKVRQLSRMLNDFRNGFAMSVVQNLVGAALFTVPAAIASGSLGVMTMLTAVTGAVTDVFFFAQFIPLIASLAPPPPDIVSVQQTGNSITVRIRRVPLDIRCRTGLATDPSSQAGLCNFQYTLYRYAGGVRDRVVVARLVPPVREDVAPGVFEVEDNYPQPGINMYYADVNQHLPLEVPDSVKFMAGTLSLPTRIGIPVGNVIGLGFITDLISDYSEPNPYPELNFNASTKADWDRVRVMYTPVPPVSQITAMRPDHQHGVFANDYGLSQFTQEVTGNTPAALAPGFGRGVGLDTDVNGNVYSVSDTSQAQFGGRVFQVRRSGEQNFIGTVNKYSALLDIGNPTQVAALAVGPSGASAGNVFVPGDVYIADNADRTIKRLYTSIIPAQGITGLPAPGGGIFGAMAASPLVGQPFVQFAACGNVAEPIKDMVFDRSNNLWAIVGTELYRIPYDRTSEGAGALNVAASLGGPQASASVSLKVRGSQKDSIATVIRGLIHLKAEAYPCTGTYTWTSSDADVVSVTPAGQGPGNASADVRGLKAGTATVTVQFVPPGGTIPATSSITVTVYDSGPIVFVHGWRGTGSGWEPVMAALESQENLLRGGSLCAQWVQSRGRFVRAKNSDDTFRAGNTDQYVCDDPADDGAFFTLNFDDNQNSFVDTAGELSDIVNQIERKLGGDECGIQPNETRTLPDTCPKLTIVAHSMGGQTSRAFIQSIPHSGLTAGDYPVGAVGIPDGGQRIGMPFRPYNGQVRRFVTIGTMNLGTPVPNLTKDETLIFFGLSSLVADLSNLFNQSVDPFSYAILSMRVDSPEWQLLSNRNIDTLKGLELVSVVTQAPQDFSINVCAALQAGDEGATQIYNGLSLPARLIIDAFALVAGESAHDFTLNVMGRLNARLCGPGNPDITDPPVIGAEIVGLKFVPGSDEIVGVDSQNVNNLFRYLDHVPNGIVHECVDETPGQTPGAIAKVVCKPNLLHHEDTGAADVLIPQMNLVAPEQRPQAPTSTTQQQTQPTPPATAALQSPSNLGVDAVGNVFVADPVAGSVTELRRDGFTNTFVTGFTGLGAIAVTDGYLYAVRNGDVIRVPLGISGQIVEQDGTPVRQATVIARGAGGVESRTFVTDANGQFSTTLEALEAQVSGDRANVFITVTTQGTDTVPSRTAELTVPLDISAEGERTQTVTRLTLPPVQ